MRYPHTDLATIELDALAENDDEAVDLVAENASGDWRTALTVEREFPGLTARAVWSSTARGLEAYAAMAGCRGHRGIAKNYSWLAEMARRRAEEIAIPCP